MSELKRLIKELCPNGVEYKELQEILTIKNGSDYKGFVKGDIPVYGSGGIMTYVDTFAFNKPSVLIPRKGSIDKLYYVDTPFWNVDTIFYTDIDTTKAIPRYVYHCLLKEHLEQYNTAGGIPSLTQKVLNKIKIPVPPLEVQREIVRILDSFTNLIQELTQELTLRKKQYSYYRDKLLTFGDDVEWKTLGEIAEVTDYVANGSFASLRENVTYKHNPDYAVLIRTVDFSAKFDKEQMIYIDEKAYNFLKKSRLFGGEIIINNIGAGVGNSFICPNLGIKMSLAPNAVMLKTNNNKFYFYWLNSKYGKNALSKIISKSAMPKFNKTGLRSLLIPVPPIEEQERIVNILDRFDTLCNDLTSGIPAEINARQKQYQYYRDKILRFN